MFSPSIKILTISTPSFRCERTACLRAQGPSAIWESPPGESTLLEVAPRSRPAARRRGPMTWPEFMASRNATSIWYVDPKLTADVKPEASIKRALRTAVIVPVSTPVSPMANGLASANDRWAWVSVIPGITNWPLNVCLRISLGSSGQSFSEPANRIRSPLTQTAPSSMICSSTPVNSLIP